MRTSTTALSLTDPAVPLLRRTAVLPNESLASLLERLTHLNFYETCGLLQTVGRERLAAVQIEDDLMQPTRLETFQQLACLTRLSLDELYEASNQRFAAGLVPLDQTARPMPWLDNTTRPRLAARWARDHLRPTDATQFCPLCLKAAAYHRLSWTPCAAAICLEHLCLLTDRCHRCWHRTTVADLVNRRCPICKADLRRARRISIAHDRLGVQSQQVIQAWFRVAKVPVETIAACHLPAQPPRVLYQLLQLLARELLVGKSEWANLPRPLNGLANSIAAAIDRHRRLTPEQAYFLYRSAFAGLVDWPEGFDRWLDAYSGWEASGTQSPRLKCLTRLQHDCLRSDWSATPLALVQGELLNYVLKRDLPLAPSVVKHLKEVPWFIEQTGLWTEEHTAQCLELPVAELRRFYPHGSLADCYWSRSQPHAPRFQQAAVLAVKHRWATGWSLKDAASWLGLQPADVLRLTELGLLSMTGEWQGDADQGLFDRQAVKAFFEQVCARLEPYPESRRDLLLLTPALYEVSDRGVDIAVLLQCVLTGLVTAYHHEPGIEALYRIYFIQSSLFGLPDRLYATRGWISGDHFAYEYDFAPYLIREWLAAGQIEATISFGRWHYFDHQQLKELAARHGFLTPVVRPTRKRRT